MSPLKTMLDSSQFGKQNRTYACPDSIYWWMAITARQARTAVRPCLLMNTILLDGFLCSEHESSCHGGVNDLIAQIITGAGPAVGDAPDAVRR